MRQALKFLPPVLASLALAACGSSSSSSSSSSASTPATSSASAGGEGAAVVKTATNGTLHTTVLVDAQGRTLYHLSGESAGKFICTSTACVQVWHPVTVSGAVTPSGASSLATVKRPDGTVQVTYRGTPLYTFSGDKGPGEDNGQNIKDVGTWTAVTTEAGSTPTEKPAATPSSGSGGSESSGSGGYGY